MRLTPVIGEGEFTVGQVVHWKTDYDYKSLNKETGRDAGTSHCRTGSVVALVPAGKPTPDAVTQFRREKSIRRLQNCTSGRMCTRTVDQPAYLVLIIPVDLLAKPPTLWCVEATALTAVWIDEKQKEATTL